MQNQNNIPTLIKKPKTLLWDLTIINYEPFVNSMRLAVRLSVAPRNTFRLICKYKSELRELGVLRFENAKGQNGRPQKFALLNEEQAIFILTLSKNTKPVVKLKKDLSRQFVAYRKAVVQKQYARLTGKKNRRELTDTIKQLVRLSKTCGSKNPDSYYKLITNLIYQLMFNLKDVPDKFRDSLGKNELNQLQLVEWKVAEWLSDSINKCLDYHEPYYEVKSKLTNLIAVIGVINLNQQIEP